MAQVDAVKSTAVEVPQEPDHFKFCGCKVPRHIGWAIIKIVLWIALVISITMTPIMMRLSFLEVGTFKQRQEKFVAATVQSSAFLLSIFIGLGISFLLYGKKGVKDCFNVKMILFLAPVSAGYSASEMIGLTAMSRSSPMIYATIHKLRLLLCALMTRVFLKRKVSTLQWAVCVTVTLCVLGFVFYSKKTGKEGDSVGTILLIINITMSCGCSIYADFAYKKNHCPFTVQMVQGRFTACAASALIAVVYMFFKGWLKYGWFGGPQGGWDRYVFCLLGFNIVRDWVNTINLLILDALYKSLGGSAAVATTYIVDALIFGRPIHAVKLFMVFSIMTGVAIYALVRQTEGCLKTALSRQKELELKVTEYENLLAAKEQSTEV